MGKIKQGILGGFKGKVGTVIGSSWNGIAYMRGLAQSVKNPKTAGQTTQRGFFREVLDIAGQLSKEQLAFLFPTAPSKMTRHNALVKQLTEVAAVDGDVKSVDLGNINSLGNAATADLPDVTIVAADENLTISWDGADGFRAEHAAGELRPDGEEVVESGWFDRGHLPEIPRPGSIARRMLDAWVAEGNA